MEQLLRMSAESLIQLQYCGIFRAQKVSPFMSIRKKYIGTPAFYHMVLAVAVPIMVQSGITNFVSLLDNIMVGRVGTNQMSGVAIINQLLFVYNLCVLGGISGAGIFTAQYYGSGNTAGVRDTFRFKIWTILVLCALCIAVFLLRGDQLIRLYLHADSGNADAEETFAAARQYLAVMCFEIIPFALTQVYAGTLRETGETLLPMKAGIAAVFVNLTFNYILIYGKFGAPALGVAGAAIATVLSRFAELGIIVIWTHTHPGRNPFIVGAFSSLRLPLLLSRNIIVRGLPLLLNEALWSSGMAVMMQNYSLRGLPVIAALNISSTISNVFNIVFIAMGQSIAIILGQRLGAGELAAAKDYSRKLIPFSVACCIVSGALMACAAPFFPLMYRTEASVRSLASGLILISAGCMPMYAFENACYFVLRSGGKTFVTFLFDSVFVWVISIPLAFCIGHFTALPILPFYLVCQLVELFKCAIGFWMVKKDFWIHNLAAEM